MTGDLLVGRLRRSSGGGVTDARRRGAGETCDVWHLSGDSLWEPAGSVPCQFLPPPLRSATTLLRLPASVPVTARTRFVHLYGTFKPSRYPPVPDGLGYQLVLVIREGAFDPT